ncbi:hypothetical protein MMPV_007007 [Pyropia vietnamensis]
MAALAVSAFVVATPVGAPSSWTGSRTTGTPPSAVTAARFRSRARGRRVTPTAVAPPSPSPSPTTSKLLKVPKTARRFLVKRPPPSLPPPAGSADAAARAARVAEQKKVYQLVPAEGLAGIPLTPDVPVAGLSWFKWVAKTGKMLLQLNLNTFLTENALSKATKRGIRLPSAGLDAVEATAKAVRVTASAVLTATSGTAEAGQAAIAKAGSPLTASSERTSKLLSTLADDELGANPDGSQPRGGAASSVIARGEAAAVAAVKAGVSQTSRAAGVPGGDAAYADFRSLFRSIPLPPVAKLVDSDDMFARLRVAGPNPMSIRAVKKQDLSATSPSLPFTDAHLQALKGYEKDTLAAATADGRLFVLDCRPTGKVLADAEKKYPSDADMVGGMDGYGKQCQFAPVALFVLSPTATAKNPGRLEPVAIAVGGPKATATPINLFTPADGSAWAAAKLIVNASDGAEQELKWHLGLTHLMINGIAAATHRELEEESHPIWRILTPHYDGLFFLNSLVPSTLLAPKETVDKLVPVSTAAAAQYVKSVLKTTHFNSLFPDVHLKARGMMDPRLDNPYREDTLAHWSILHEFVSEFVGCYYPNDAAVVADYELQAWAAAITAGGQLGFGERAADGSTATPGAISSVAYLIDAITLIIFTGSVQHAAINFPQHDLMTYTPFYPLGVRLPPSMEGGDGQIVKEQGGSIREWLPSPNIALLQLSVCYLLGSVIHQPLGTKPMAIRQWGGWYQNRKVSIALNRMNRRLIELEKHIARREANNEVKYEYLRPTRVPRSINI